MQRSPFLPITEQVAAYLGEELRRGRWKGAMPGRNQLVRELGRAWAIRLFREAALDYPVYFVQFR